ncbi:Brachyury protein, partial [Plakobranchus ocellatus]
MLDSTLKCEFPGDRCVTASTDLSLASTMTTLPSMDINHLLSAVDQDLHQQQQQQHHHQQQQQQNDGGKHGVMAGGDSSNNPERHLNVVLEDRELWEKFKEFTNEMIVTKNG